ncbi:LacI family DNA-binding transcriptional regulator [Botryobacter ruber]|uniref:LacI family DNA-binding transcriptional regulator n=1 Tax=Botryobacter ruber TaxID=2171629 RepID=UPI000E0B4228|nr:LacI family DNA-binding transcriptional regulator [Botryobacter ruber]
MTKLIDVAKAAGVSIATVSRVLNNPETVNADTQQRVQQAIKSLNFRPSRVAQRLRSKGGNSKIIGLVLPDIQNPFYVDVIRGIEEVMYEHGYAAIMCNFAQDEKRERLYLDILKSESIDGLIVAPVHGRDQKVAGLVLSGLPIVCIDRGLTGVEADVVLVDNQQGAYDAVSHLIKLGHRRIAYISGLPQIPTSRARLAGYEMAFRENELVVDEELIKYGDSKHESGMKLTEELLALPTPPTALFTGNNLITLGALETIHRQGLKIPEEIALVGFDDMYWSISLNPPLTAVKQPGFEMGKRAAELLFQRIKDPSRPTAKVVFDAKLQVRSSCGATTIKTS